MKCGRQFYPLKILRLLDLFILRNLVNGSLGAKATSGNIEFVQRHAVFKRLHLLDPQTPERRFLSFFLCLHGHGH